MKLPVLQWRYRGQNYVQHIGPMAQDFYRLFQLGQNDRIIQSVDIDGVILSAIQGLGHSLYETEKSDESITVLASKIHNDMDTFSQILDTARTSGDVLLSTNDRLNQRYDYLHEKEFKQTKKVKLLHDRLLLLHDQLGGLK